jgi:predicted ATPase
MPDRKGGAHKGLVFETDGGIVPAELESDGVLLTLAYLCLSRQEARVLGVEEPETAAYPQLVAERFKLLKTMAEGDGTRRPVQIIATTHSASLLTAAASTSLVRVVETQDDGTSRIFEPSEESMQDLIYRRLGWSL